MSQIQMSLDTNGGEYISFINQHDVTIKQANGKNKYISMCVRVCLLQLNNVLTSELHWNEIGLDSS